MTSPFLRSPQRNTHMGVKNAEIHEIPPSEGFLLDSNRIYKYGAAIDYTHNERTSGNQKRSYVIVPGFGGIKPAYGDFRDAKAHAANDDVISYRHPRTKLGLHNLHPDELLHPDKLGKQAVVAMIDHARTRHPDRKVTLIGHSMGGPNAVAGALRRPNDVESVVLLGSGGLEEGQNLVRLGKRLPKIAAQEGKTMLEFSAKDAVNMFGQSVYHMARNPLRTLGEAVEIGNRDLMVKELNVLRAKKIGIHAVQLELDGFFPTEIAEHDTDGLVDSFTVIEGLDHLGPQSHPEIVAEHIANVLSNSNYDFMAHLDKPA